MKIWNADNTTLGHLVTGTYGYAPKEVWVEAILITLDNIGALALELESEIKYDADSVPFVWLRVWREELTSLEAYELLKLRPGFWLVPLRGELHLIDEYTFEQTFIDSSTLNSEGVPYEEWEEDLKDYAKKDVAESVPPNVVSSKHAMSVNPLNRPSVPEERRFPYQQPVKNYTVPAEVVRGSIVDPMAVTEDHLAALREKLAQEPDDSPVTQYIEWEGNVSYEYAEGDRVRIDNSAECGTVTVTNVEEAGVRMIEVEVDNFDPVDAFDEGKRLFEPTRLKKI